MRYRLLGKSGLRVSELFLGAMTFGKEAGLTLPLKRVEHRTVLSSNILVGDEEAQDDEI